MTRLSEPKYTPFYDLFKLIVAVILVVILILLLLRDRQQMSAQSLSTLTQPTATATFKPSSAPSTPVATETARPESTPVVQPTASEPIPTSDPKACPSAPTHIQKGDKVRVIHWLYLRAHPGLNSRIIVTNEPGAVMDVIGGPVCTFKSATETSRAYLWWNVRMENGREGWSAEAPLVLPYYFMESIR